MTEDFLPIIAYIFAFFVSLWFGNFITSFYFRIPRGISLNGKENPPMCSTCGIRLKYPDYGPLYYYIFRGKSCKTCGAPIPPEYFFIELFTALTCLTTFAVHGVSEKSCLMVFVILSYILALLINASHGKVPEKSLWIAFLATIAYTFYSLKFEQSVMYIIVTNSAFGFAFGMILQKLIIKKPLPQGYMPILALISIIQTKGLSVLMFTIAFILIAIFHKKIALKHFMNGVIAIALVLLILDISYPYLELT
ncbi:MAG: hypothetical protein ACI9CD_000464 [Candidatus Deianiraeaceae bacterium]|jgi:hypothetical protein